MASLPEWIRALLSATDAVLGWLDAHAALLVFLATGATALVAWQSHRREERRDERRRAAVDARIRMNGYELAETLTTWLTERRWPTRLTEDFDEFTVKEAIQVTDELRPEFAGARHLAREMAAAAPDASPAVEQMASSVYARLLPALEGLTEIARLNERATYSSEGFQRKTYQDLGHYRAVIGEIRRRLLDETGSLQEISRGRKP